MASDRYRRQLLLSQIGPAGQKRLGQACVLQIGVGALGCGTADLLARAGVGRLVLVDRDVVDLSNLHRQVLFDESHAIAGMPKALAAAERIGRINSEIIAVPVATDVTSDNFEQLIRTHRPTVILDGTDNVQTRYLLNDVAVKAGVPWVYGGCVGVEGRVMAVLPGRTPCLRCLFPNPPAPADLPTCETAGVLGPAVAVVAARQAMLAIRIITGAFAEADVGLLSFDAWAGRFHTTSIAGERATDCPACVGRVFEFLDTPPASARLCGRNTVQLRLPASDETINVFDRVEQRLAATDARTARGPGLLRYELEGLQFSLFPDGRLLVHGTNDVTRARVVVDRYFG